MPTAESSSTLSLPDTLKADTAERHRVAEHHPVQQQLLKGKLTKDQFADLLEQMLVVHRAMRTSLTRLRTSRPEFASLLHDDFFQDVRLEQDLRFFGRDPENITAHTEAQATATHINQLGTSDNNADNASLLGWQYVLEGSNNGNMYIARAVGPSLGLTSQDGLRFLTPHGQSQHPKWQKFRAELAQATLSEAETAAIKAQAAEAFDAITRMMGDLESAWVS